MFNSPHLTRKQICQNHSDRLLAHSRTPFATASFLPTHSSSAEHTNSEVQTFSAYAYGSIAIMAAQTDDVAALKRRIEELERAVAEHESGAVVEPHLAANKELESTCQRLRQRCEQLERENSTLALALAYRQVSGGAGGADDDATAEVPS